MKKSVSLLLFAAILFWLPACAEPKTPYALYTQSQEKLGKADSMRAETDIVLSLSYMGLTIDIGTTLDAKMHMENGAVQMEGAMMMAMFGQEISGHVYYTDGYYYSDMMGTKIKTKQSVEEIFAESAGGRFGFAEEAILEQQQNALDGGGCELVFTLDGAGMTDLIKPQLGDLAELIGHEGIRIDAPVHLRAVLDNPGDLQSVEMDFTLTIEIEGQPASAAAKITYHVLQTGNITISLPDDLNTYIFTD